MQQHPIRFLPFIKMEGCWNDYVFLDAGIGSGAQALPADAPYPDWARAMSDRHTGVGGDGLILLLPGTRGAVRMRMWNADGSEGRLCLNGLRCAAKYTAEETGSRDAFLVETVSGDRPVRVFRGAAGRVDTVEVDAGIADFRRESLPARGAGPEIWGEPFPLAGRDLRGHGVSVGNPHLVFFLESASEVSGFSLDALAPLSRDSRFPEGINVHVAALAGPHRLVMRSWERGTGPTLACGSGAVAVYAASRRLAQAGAEITVGMPGGDVTLREDDGARLFLSGPAREVFRGTWPVR